MLAAKGIHKPKDYIKTLKLYDLDLKSLNNEYRNK